MQMKMKKYLLLAIGMIVLGSAVFAAAMFSVEWDFARLNTAGIETATYPVDAPFENIVFADDTADITVLPSSQGEASLTAKVFSGVTYTVDVTDGVLNVSRCDSRKWYQKLLTFGNEQVYLYLPEKEYGKITVNAAISDIEISEGFTFGEIDIFVNTGDVVCLSSAVSQMKIRTTTGDISVAGVSVGTLSLSVRTGDLSLYGIACEGAIEITCTTADTELTDVRSASLTSTGDTGDIELEKVIVSGEIKIKRTTGDVSLEGCDAGEIYIRTKTGDVEGTLLSAKSFLVQTNTGDTCIPPDGNGGRCEIITDTGDILIFVE